MKLPFSFSIKKREKPEYFLALLLRDHKATAVIFEELSGKVKVIGEHESYFSDSIETASDEELLETLDEAISQAENPLPPNIQTHKTIFGVKETWVKDSRIQRVYLTKLKKISEALSLLPIGFLVITEAIAHLMQKEEGAPLSALIAEISEKTITVTLLKAGRVIETRSVQREEQPVVIVVDTLLKSFTETEVMPARIILIDSSKTDSSHHKHSADYLAQSFIGHSWSKTLPFLHVPQIMTLPKGFDAKAVLFGAASQMGFEVLGTEENLPKRANRTHQEKQTAKEDNQQNLSQEEINHKQDEKTTAYEQKENLHDFGFIVNGDIAQTATENEEEPKGSHEKKDTIEQVEKVENETPDKGSKTMLTLTFFSQMIAKNARSVSKILPKRLLLPSIPFHNKAILTIVAVILLLFASAFFYFTIVKATLIVRVTPKVIEQTQQVSFAPQGSSDFDKNQIAAKTITTEEKGSVDTPTTGKKEVGEKAKGTVTIYSKLAQSKTFSEGTVLKASNGLEFVTDKAVTVASAAADLFSPPVTATISITAKDIGKEYNFPSGTRFNVGSFDATDVAAKNDTAFAGGSKKEIPVVAKADVDKLTQDLLKNLETKAKDDLAKKSGSDELLIPIITDKTINDKKLDNDVGKEAKTVSLTGTVTYASIVSKKQDIEAYARHIFGNKIDKMKLSDKGISFTPKDLQVTTDKLIQSNLAIKASLIPSIDKNSFLSQIRGASFDKAKEIVGKIPQVASVDVLLSPPLPFLPKVLPQREKNIEIQIEIQ